METQRPCERRGMEEGCGVAHFAHVLGGDRCSCGDSWELRGEARAPHGWWKAAAGVTQGEMRGRAPFDLLLALPLCAFVGTEGTLRK